MNSKMEKWGDRKEDAHRVCNLSPATTTTNREGKEKETPTPSDALASYANNLYFLVSFDLVSLAKLFATFSIAYL